MDENNGNVFKWPFLNEPLYRWFIFLIALSFFFAAWKMILDYTK